MCELLSKSTAVEDMTEKLPLYARHGVSHTWNIDASLQMLEVYQLDGQRWVLAQTFGALELGRVIAHSQSAHGGRHDLGFFDAVEPELAALLLGEIEGVDARLRALHDHGLDAHVALRRHAVPV